MSDKRLSRIELFERARRWSAFPPDAFFFGEEYDLPNTNEPSPYRVRVTNGKSQDSFVGDGFGGTIVGGVALLNFASAKHPGGGVARGAIAQEEDLCLCSNLYDSLGHLDNHTDFYKMEQHDPRVGYHDKMAISYNTNFLLDGSFNPLPPDSRRVADVYTLAAPNMREPGMTPELAERLVKRRLRAFFHIASVHDYSHYILGAWGCGVFLNNPEMVAKAFREEMLRLESKVEPLFVFPIYNNPEVEKAFRDVFEN